MLQAQLDLVLEQKRLLEGHLADLHSQPRPVAAAPLKRSAPMAAAIKTQPSKRQRVRSPPLAPSLGRFERVRRPRGGVEAPIHPLGNISSGSTHHKYVTLRATCALMPPPLIQPCPSLSTRGVIFSHVIILLQVGGEKGKRLEVVWQQVSTVLKALMKQRDAQTFSTPVDAIKLGVRPTAINL